MLPSMYGSLMHVGSLPTLIAMVALLCLGRSADDLVCESHVMLSCGTTPYAFTHTIMVSPCHLQLHSSTHTCPIARIDDLPRGESIVL